MVEVIGLIGGWIALALVATGILRVAISIYDLYKRVKLLEDEVDKIKTFLVL